MSIHDREKSILNSVSLLLLVVCFLPFVFSHEGEENLVAVSEAHDFAEAQDLVDNQRAVSNDWSMLNPLHHFSERKWVAGLATLVLWVVLLKGIYTLCLLVLSRLSH